MIKDMKNVGNGFENLLQNKYRTYYNKGIMLQTKIGFIVNLLLFIIYIDNRKCLCLCYLCLY